MRWFGPQLRMWPMAPELCARESPKSSVSLNLTDLPDEPAQLFSPDFALVRRVLYLGSFVMFAMVTQFLVNAADSAMCGRLDPTEATAAQAALGLGMPLFWGVCGFFAAISYGTQALTARRTGEGSEHAAGQVLFNSLLVAVGAGLVGSAIGYFTADPAVRFLAESSEAQRHLATRYAEIRSLGIGGVVIAFSFKAFFDGIGRTYVHLIAALAMNIGNIALNYLLIFGSPSLGIPRMGLEGAAWASTISTYFGTAVMIGASLLPRYRLRFRFYQRSNFAPAIMRDIVRLMVPSGSATVFLMAGFLLFAKFVGQLDAAAGGGTSNTYAAATTALFNTAAMVAMPLFAFGTATATAVSQSLGAHKPNLAARYAWEAVRVGILTVLPLTVLFWIMPESIIAAWSPHDVAVQTAAAWPLRLVGSALPLMVVGILLSQALYGAGANDYVAKVEASLHAGVLVPLSWLLGPALGLGLVGAWSAPLVYVALLALAMVLKFRGSHWRTIKI